MELLLYLLEWKMCYTDGNTSYPVLPNASFTILAAANPCGELGGAWEEALSVPYLKFTKNNHYHEMWNDTLASGLQRHMSNSHIWS